MIPIRVLHGAHGPPRAAATTDGPPGLGVALALWLPKIRRATAQAVTSQAHSDKTGSTLDVRASVV